MKIPWLTPIIGAISDGKIAALLEKQVVHLARERDDALVRLSEAETKIEALELKVKKLEPKPSADPKAVKALKVFYKHSTELNAFQLADLMKIEVGKSKHFISSLMVAGFIKSNCTIRDKFGPKYIITDAGNELLSKEKELSPTRR
jgi:hypothetical protein